MDAEVLELTERLAEAERKLRAMRILMWCVVKAAGGEVKVPAYMIVLAGDTYVLEQRKDADTLDIIYTATEDV